MAGLTIADLPKEGTVLLEDTAVRGAAPAAATVNGRPVVLSSSGAAEGGPGPADPLSSLALRQRVLSEAALRVLDDQEPLVVQLPSGTDHHGLSPSFFSGLEAPWLRLTTLDSATGGTAPPLSGARLRSPGPDSGRLGAGLYDEANQVIGDGTTLQSILIGNTVLRRQIFDETTSNASYAAARDPFTALRRVRSTADWVNGNLRASTWRRRPRSLSPAPTATSPRSSATTSTCPSRSRSVQSPTRGSPSTGGETVNLPAHGRSSVLLNASTHVLGVHSVTLQLTNKAGRPLGAEDTFPVRAEAVSRLIWVIIGAGVVLLFGAIVVRLVRRVVRSRAS